jgi:sirohydrochlorin ferrochelatase
MNEKESQVIVSSTACDCTEPCENCTCRETESKRESSEKLALGVTSFMVWLLVFCSISWGQAPETGQGGSGAKPGLMIIAHGAPSPAWNQPVVTLEEKVQQNLGETNPFAKVKVVFMEFAEPNVADGVTAMEEAGCSRIVAVPLLIAPSSHSHWDVPALLGLYSDSALEEELRAEGIAVVRSRLPITITPTLSEGDVIERIMLKRLRQLSQDPEKEAVVLLAHGDSMTGSLWQDLMRRNVTYLCGRTGISYGDWACVAVGQEYEHAVAAIARAAEHRDRVIVVGGYLSMGVKRMHQRWMSRFEKTAPMPGLTNPLEGLSVSLSEQGLLPDEAVAQWITDIALGEVRRHQ